MDRLQKKCVIASAGVHLLLALILFVGPAFLSGRDRPDNSPILDIIPSKLIDAPFSGGGNPDAKPPPPAPLTPVPSAPPATKPEPIKIREPEKANEPAPQKLDPDALELKDLKKKPDISLTPVTRKPESRKTTKQSSTDDTQEKQLADKRRKAAELLGSTARSLRDDISSSTSVEMPGPGGGGEAYASYDEIVRSMYWHAWVAPEDTASDTAVVRATVIISRDGTVISARITAFSGDANVDKSVQRALERVTFVAPFPQGAKDQQRTYPIKFDLRAKRLNG